ncbi:MAG: hypothetical protein LUG51_06640 [Tannerellaceae bacterium]|nr:hypothetical protein [Tannerellaceae bacterium]
MKRILTISCMLLATLVVIVFAVFPHHHHGGVACMVMDVCDSQDPINEEHPHHHHAGDMEHHNHLCISGTEFINETTKEEVKCKVCVCHNCTHTHHLPILFLLPDFLIYEEISVAKPEYGEFIVFYKSIDASQTHGLRAPPFLTV